MGEGMEGERRRSLWESLSGSFSGGLSLGGGEEGGRRRGGGGGGGGGGGDLIAFSEVMLVLRVTPPLTTSVKISLCNVRCWLLRSGGRVWTRTAKIPCPLDKYYPALQGKSSPVGGSDSSQIFQPIKPSPSSLVLSLSLSISLPLYLSADKLCRRNSPAKNHSKPLKSRSNHSKPPHSIHQPKIHQPPNRSPATPTTPRPASLGPAPRQHRRPEASDADAESAECAEATAGGG